MKYLTLLCIIILACKGTSRKTTGNAGIEEREASTTECFLNTRGRDTSMMLLNSSRDSVSGIMSYLPLEKDSRKGEIKGIIKMEL